MTSIKKAKNQQEVINHLEAGGEVCVHFKEVFRFQMNPKKVVSFHEGLAIVESDAYFNVDFNNAAVDFWELKSNIALNCKEKI